MKSILAAIALAAAFTVPAQPQSQVTPAPTYGAKEAKKKERAFHVFWSAARKDMPPLPFNPFPDLALYDAGDNNLIYDDREVDYPALQAAMAEEQAKARAASGEAFEEGGGGGMAMMMSSASTNLTLAAPVFDGTNVQLTIENGVEDEFYDLFYSTNLVDWHFYVRTDTNQFSFSIAPPAWPVCFFRLGTQQDTDDDTLTDAYELLVAQTSPTFPDSAQTLAQYTNLNTFQVSNNLAALTDHPPVLKLYLYERDYSHMFLDDACSFGCCNSFDSQGYRTRWTNDVGGFYTNSLVKKYCPTGNAVVTTNLQREGRMAANTLGTNQIRSRVDNEAWSAWTNDVNGLVPWPGDLLIDQSYRQTSNLQVWSTNPPESYLTTDSTRTTMRYYTRGPQFSTLERRHKITVGATAYDNLGSYTTVSNALISILGQPGNSNGVFYVTLRDNMTTNLTPSLPPQYTNYSYTISAERHLIPLNFRTVGQLTNPDTNGVGYDFIKYGRITEYVDPQLGVHATIDDGTLAGQGICWRNLEEISATVPTSPYASWQWHQDVRRTRYMWTNGATQVTETEPPKIFSTAGPSGGNDLAPNGQLSDPDPDSQGNIYFADAPALQISDPVYVNAPMGAVAALRFYSHTWLTANGLFASDILKWRTFITIKKTTNGWVRVGTNNFIELTPAGHSEVPEFTVQEAEGLNP